MFEHDSGLFFGGFNRNGSIMLNGSTNFARTPWFDLVVVAGL